MCGRPWEGVWYLRFVACSWNCGMSSGLHLFCSDYLPGVQQAVGWPLSLGSRRSPLRRNATLLNAAAAAVFIGDRITHVSQTCSAALRSSPDTHSHDTYTRSAHISSDLCWDFDPNSMDSGLSQPRENMIYRPLHCRKSICMWKLRMTTSIVNEVMMMSSSDRAIGRFCVCVFLCVYWDLGLWLLTQKF